MKKLLLLLLINFSVFSQTVTYTPSTANIYNPERGFHRYTSAKSNNYNSLTNAQLSSYKANGNSIVLRVFYLFDFLSAPISATYLTKMQQDFSVLRNNGMKCIVKFAYSDDDSAGVTYNPPKAKILQDIAQVTPVLQANKDVIMCLQLGWIGAWGELDTSTVEFCNTVGNYNNWYTPPYTTNNCIANRKEVFQTFMDVLPDRYFQIRMPSSKMALYGNTPINEFGTDYKHRLGQHNDCFVSSADDYWTYIPTPPAPEYPYLQQETKFVPMGGETCNLYPPRSNYTTAEQELRGFHYTYLNEDYNTDVLSYWGTNINDVRKYLGYRLELVSLSMTGNNMSLTINNTGYAAPFNKRDMEIVFKNNTTSVEYKKVLSYDIRNLLGVKTITETIDTSDLPNGAYSLYLNIPDYNTSLRTNPLYSIQCANTGVWMATKGYNDLNITVNVTNSSCVLGSTTWNGVSWSNGTPNVNTTAIINAPYTVNGVNPTVNFDCCNLVVNSTLQINANRFVTFQNDVSGTGSILVKNGGKLIPVNDSSTCNLNNITVERATPVLKKYDYTYFSSPTKNTNIGTSLTNWWQNRTFTFDGSKFIDTQTWYMNTFISNIPDGQDDAPPSPWILAPFSDSFKPALGYPSMIINGTFPRTETVGFSGCLNTGIVTTPLIISGNPVALNYNPNIIGNPYSSSILADSFIIDNLPNISGTLYFWTHTGTLSTAYTGSAQYNFSQNDYASYNLSGGIAANFGGNIPSGFIPSCQGFMVFAESSVDVVFKPSYMAAGYPNNSNIYFRSSSPFTRLWLDLHDVEEGGLFKQILINYNSDTSLEYDKGWDAKVRVYDEPIKFYTIGDYEIESRGDFDTDDIVSLGYKSFIENDYVISLHNIENIEEVFLYDNYLGIFHNLLMSDYVFHSLSGVFNDRFSVHYKERSLNVFGAEKQEYKIVPNPTKNIFAILFDNSKNSPIFVTDTYGRNVSVKIQSSFKDRIIVDLSNVSSGTYIVKINEVKLKVIKK